MLLRNIIELLQTEDYFDGEELIQIAKGKYKTPTTFREGIHYLKRNDKWPTLKRS